MTIAVSVVARKSPLLTAMLLALCVGVASVGIVIGCGMVGELSLLTRLACLSLTIALAARGLIHALKKQYPYQLDITGTGQIRLTLLTESVDRIEIGNNDPRQRGLLVTLLPDSTLWARFMMLRLRDDSGRVHALPIWPDSMPEASFRALAVACRWISGHRFAE
jgi:hypothetical protein